MCKLVFTVLYVAAFVALVKCGSVEGRDFGSDGSLFLDFLKSSFNFVAHVTSG